MTAFFLYGKIKLTFRSNVKLKASSYYYIKIEIILKIKQGNQCIMYKCTKKAFLPAGKCFFNKTHIREIDSSIDTSIVYEIS